MLMKGAVMDKIVEDALTKNIQEMRASLVIFQEETRENFRKVDDRFATVDGQFAKVRAEMLRIEQNNLALFSLLFAHLGIEVPADLLK